MLGVTKRNDKYKNVPDKLKWAIPIYEAATSAESKKRIKQVHADVLRKLDFEKRQQVELTLISLPKP